MAAGHKSDQLARAAASLRELPEDDAVRRTLVEILPAASRAETVRQLATWRASNVKAAGYATARLARLMIDHHRCEEVLPLLAELEGRFGAVVSAEGKTGGQLGRAWRLELGRQNGPGGRGPLAGHTSLRQAPGGRPRHAAYDAGSRRPAKRALFPPMAV